MSAAERPTADTAWDFLTHGLEDDAAEAFLEQVESSPEALAALLEASEDVLLLRSLGDRELREALAGTDAPAMSADELLTLDHDPDARLDAALADGHTRRTVWQRFRSFAARPSGLAMVAFLAAAMALLVVGQPREPVPDYHGDWFNGAAENRAETGVVGRYLFTNRAELRLYPDLPTAPDDLEVKVFLGRNGGALEPVAAETEVGKTRAVRVFIDVTPEVGLGTHRVVVLVGPDLDGVDPETDSEEWARVEREMLVVDAL